MRKVRSCQGRQVQAQEVPQMRRERFHDEEAVTREP